MGFRSLLFVVSAMQLKSARSFAVTSLPPVKLLAYGDSLTAGWHDGGMGLTPYAPELQAGLEEALGPRAVLVRHKGLPGWTAASMLNAATTDAGLTALLQRAQAAANPDADKEQHTITACIIIAGTNDLAYASDSAEVADAVLELHASAHTEGVKTISVDIPPSAAAAVQPAYGKMRSMVNEKLQESARNDNMRIHVPCPVSFHAGGPGAAMWEPDGLHMSSEGYKALGKGLVSSVLAALREWEVVEAN